MSVASSAGSSSTAKGKGRSREEPILVDQDDLPENLTHTAQAALPKSTLADEPVSLDEKAAEENGFGALYAGMTDQEVFDAVTRPDGIAGLEDWGIPPAADPSECSPQLKVHYKTFASRTSSSAILFSLMSPARRCLSLKRRETLYERDRGKVRAQGRFSGLCSRRTRSPINQHHTLLFPTCTDARPKSPSS